MCDTIALRTTNAVWLAKNSDRDPLEAQRVEVIPAVRADRSKILRATWMEIPQVPNRHACIIARPAWMWGAEMGVNQCGLAIGNEAIFSRSVQRKGAALLGMDLVRLALERAESADAALEVITGLLERHGQGGPAGYTQAEFRYDNSFLIADSRKIWKLETAGRQWVAREVPGADSISNGLTIGRDYQRASSAIANGERINFRKRFDTLLMPLFGASRQRRAASLKLAGELASSGEADFADFARILRYHRKSAPSGNGDLCMHAAAQSSPLRALRPSHTVNAMIVRLTELGPQMVFTGTSSSCVSVFKPVDFSGHWHVCQANLWERHWVQLQHWQSSAQNQAQLQAAIARSEAEIFSAIEAGNPARADELARNWSQQFLQTMPLRSDADSITRLFGESL